MPDDPIRIGGTEVPPGTRAQVELPVARLPTGALLSLPVTVISGASPGPNLWLDAAIHGDELNGVEIIRRLLRQIEPSGLAGNLLAVPIVNVVGFVHQDRYLPDRRDLNRSFPGSPKGSLAARLAHLFVSEVVAQCRYGIDLHTGSLHRTNLPQIRADLDDPETRLLAEAFGAPLIYKAGAIRGSLRSVATKRGVCLLVYEGGEPQRFNREMIEMGCQGVLRVLSELGMWSASAVDPPSFPTFEASDTRWLRASRSGIFHLAAGLGERVEKGRSLGYLSDLFSDAERHIRAPFGGLVLGFTRNPLVYQGDALVHLARPVADSPGLRASPCAGRARPSGPRSPQSRPRRRDTPSAS